MRLRAPLVLALSLVIAGCACGCAPTTCPPTGPAAPVHERATDEAALMQTDRDFAAATAARGVDGWLAFFADDGGQMVDRKGVVQGKAAIRALMTPTFARPNRKLEWAPTRAEARGDLGFTIGKAQLVEIGEGGARTVLARLQYLTVWRRQADGSWKVVLDTGSDDAPDPATPPMPPPPPPPAPKKE